MSVFVQPNQKTFIGPENKPEPIVSESFVVNVQSAECRCSVTAFGDVESGCRRVIPIRKCNDSHDARLLELAAIATKRMNLLIADMVEQRRPA